jgi:thiamine biosynthesis lipoprotein
MRLTMGTFVSMTLIHPSRDEAEEALGRAFDEIERLSGLMNRFDEATAVALLNKEGRLTDVPPEVTEVVDRSLHHYRLTHGTFDITVKPVVDLFKEKLAGSRKTEPTDKELKQALSLIGSDRIRVGKKDIRFDRPGMGITLDGIAKGYIVDRASDVLSKQNIKNHLINAGGDIRTSGVRNEKKPWTVAIEDPNKKRNYPDAIRLTDGAVATSGNYEIYYDREKMFHHIVDPRTGMSPHLNASVSVVTKTAMDADALATSIFVMETKEGMRFMNSLPGCECLVISDEGRLTKSKGWKSAAI